LQTSGFHDALDDDDLLRRPDAMTNLLMFMGSALECERNDAGKIHLLNKIRTSKFLTAHLSVYFANMMTETSGAKLRSFKQPIKAGLLISIIAIGSDTIERYFCSIAIGIADTFMRKYRYRYRRYFFRQYRYRISAILSSIAVDY
jgi:hypothetical protein